MQRIYTEKLSNGTEVHLFRVPHENKTKCGYVIKHNEKEAHKFWLPKSDDPITSEHYTDVIEDLNEAVAAEVKHEVKLRFYNRINSKTSRYMVVEEKTADKEPGIYLLETKYNDKTQKEETKETYICTCIYISKKIASESANWYEVVYYDRDKQKKHIVKAGDLFLHGLKENYDFKHLRDNGLKIASKQLPAVIDYLQCMESFVEEVQGTEKIGWNKGEYISNGLNTSKIIFTGRPSVAFEVAGDQEMYYARLKQIYSENPLVFFIASYCASGFFNRFLRNEANQILAITSRSSKGKSTVGKLALSMFTHPRYFKGMDGTKIGMAALAKNHNDNFVFFDENSESEMTQEERISFVYKLANASDRIKMERKGDSFQVANDNTEYKYAVLIAGEKSFLQGSHKGTGLDARFIEIVLPKSIPLWESIKSSDEAEELNQFIQDNYGHLAIPFIELVKATQTEIQQLYVARLKEIRDELQAEDSITQRKARILAYTYIASKYIATIIASDDVADEMANNAYLAGKSALFANEEIEPAEDLFKDELAHIEETQRQYFIVKKNNIEQTDGIIKDYNGYISLNTEYKEIGIISTKFTALCVRMGLDEKLFLSYLQEHNLLIHDKGRHTKKVMVNNNRASYYQIRVPHIFFEDNQEIPDTTPEDKTEDKDIPW